jgi:LCP family protein required for cell wall assembly
VPTSRGDRRRWLRLLASVIALLVLVAIVDAARLWRRIDRFEVIAPPVADRRETWLLIGSDDRSRLASLASDPTMQDDQGGGARADIVMVLQRSAGQTHAVSISRDLLLQRRAAAPLRLGVALTRGPQEVVDSLCEGLGISADHVVVLEMQGFSDLVDAVGGITVDVEAPMRDRSSGLDLASSGRQVLDGSTALAWIRAREPELHRGGRWVPAADGDAGRVFRSATALAALSSALPAPWTDPVGARRVAGRIAGRLSMSASVQPTDARSLAALLEQVGPAVDLPVVRQDGELPLASLDPSALPILHGLGADADPEAACAIRLPANAESGLAP